MTNKPMLSVERELIQRIADHCKFWIDHPYLEAIADVEVELRALLDAQHVVCSNGILCQNIKCAECGGNGAYKPASQHQADPAVWSYCPECGCEELHHEEGKHKQCKNCHQEWFSDINYSEVVRGNLQKLKSEQPAPVAVVMPERMYSDSLPSWAEEQKLVRGWNACLAEVARLNGVKP